jgi:hypothetical protein
MTMSETREKFLQVGQPFWAVDDRTYDVFEVEITHTEFLPDHDITVAFCALLTENPNPRVKAAFRSQYAETFLELLNSSRYSFLTEDAAKDFAIQQLQARAQGYRLQIEEVDRRIAKLRGDDNSA